LDALSFRRVKLGQFGLQIGDAARRYESRDAKAGAGEEQAGACDDSYFHGVSPSDEINHWGAERAVSGQAARRRCEAGIAGPPGLTWYRDTRSEPSGDRAHPSSAMT